MLVKFIRKSWVDYLDSFDHEAISKTDCRPTNVAFIATAMAVVIAAMGYLPYLKEVAGLEQAVIPIVLVIAGGMFSILTWWSYPNRTMVGVFQLFDSPFYATALIATGTLSKPPVSYIFAGFFIAACLAWAMLYATTFLGISVLVAGTLTPGWILGADTPMYIMIVTGLILYVFFSRTYREKRILKARQERSEVVLKHIDDLFSRSVTGSTYLNQIPIRTLLHDVKNELSFATWNLNFIQTDKLSEEEKKVWEDAKAGILHAFSTAQDYFDKEKDGTTSSQIFWLSDLPDDLLEIPSLKETKGRLDIQEFPEVAVRGSLDLVGAAVKNLAENALEAGADKVVVRASKEEQSRSAVIEISDNGPGLPDAVLEKIFSPFNTYGKEKGVGLGIYLSRRIVETMGGKLDLVSTDSAGALFTIVLPVTTSFASEQEDSLQDQLSVKQLN